MQEYFSFASHVDGYDCFRTAGCSNALIPVSFTLRYVARLASSCEHPCALLGRGAVPAWPQYADSAALLWHVRVDVLVGADGGGSCSPYGWVILQLLGSCLGSFIRVQCHAGGASPAICLIAVGRRPATLLALATKGPAPCRI
jgi:hypothetical protein